MKTIPTYFFLLLSVSVIAQDDDDFCICMLDQPAYEASLDNGNLDTENEFSKLFSPQINQTSEDTQPLIFLQEDIDDTYEDELEDDEILEEVKAKRPSSRKRIKTKKKARVPKWNPNKKPKKYKGQCPFF